MPSAPIPRRSLFAVWHWRWWTWVVVVLLLLAMYLLSAVPVYHAALVLHLDRSGLPVKATVDLLYAPAWWIAEHTDIGGVIFCWEWNAMEWATGGSDWVGLD